jgi:hypothetical protein
MKKVEITYEVTRRYSETFNVTADEYYIIAMNGEIPIWIKKDLENGVKSDDSYESTDWAAVEGDTGKDLVYWKEK